MPRFLIEVFATIRPLFCGLVGRSLAATMLTIMWFMTAAHAQQVTVISQGSSTATGAGLAGVPSLSINVPDGDNRAIFILPSFEREHCSANDDANNRCVSGSSFIGDNHVSSATSAPSNQMTIRIAGPGSTIDKINPLVLPAGDLRFMRISNNISVDSAIAFLSLENFHYAIYESEIETLLGGAASGNITISLPNARTPLSDGDDASLMAVVFENVNESNTGIVRNGTSFGSEPPQPGNITLANTNLDAGQEIVDPKDGFIVYGASYGGGPTSMGFATMPGFTELFDYTTTNANGHMPDAVTNYSETDGLTVGLQFRSGPGSGSIDSFSLQGSGAAATEIFGALAASFKIDYARADLEVTKVVTSGPPRVGENVTFRITVTNDGPDNADLIEVLDALPNGYSYASHTASQGTYTLSTGVWDIGYVADQASVTLDVVATVLATGDYTNRAEVTNSSVFDPDSTPNDNTGDDAASLTITPAAALRDYGDARQTLTSYGNPDHLIIENNRLGATITAEATGFDSINADGDVDDGVSIPALIRGQASTITATIVEAAPGEGFLQGWIDWDGDGTFNAGDQIATNLQDDGTGDDATAGDGTITFSVTPPLTATALQTVARFRWSTTSGLNSTAAASDGEVEDYPIDILSPGNFTINTTEGNACVAAGGTLGTTNFFTDLDGGTFGFGSGAADEIPSTDPYGAQITGGIFINTFSGFTHGNYTYVSNNQTPRNGSQHGGGIYDPVNGPTGRFFVSDPDVSTPTFSTELQSLTFGQSYEVSFWAADSELSTSQYNRIGIFADNVEIYNTGFLQNTTSVMEWKKYSFVYTHMSALPTVDLDIRSLETGAGGRDFFFDEVNINECVKTTDYSDAPTTGTTYGDAAHTVVAGIQLGDLIDADTGSLASPDADGDGTDDDGVTLPSMTLGETATVSVNVTGAGGYLQAWADWEKDGNFTGTYDQIALNVQDGGAGDTDGVANGVITLSVFPPWEGTNNVQTFARFRWSTTQDLNSTTVASDGEVEDYALTVQPALPVPPLGQCSVSQVSLGGTLDGGTSISGALSNNGLTAIITGTSTNNQFGSARRILEDVSGTMTFTSSALLSDLELALWNIQASNLMGNFKVTLGDGTVISNPSFAIAYDIGVHPNFLADGSVGERLGKTTGSDGNTYVFDPHANGGNEQAAGRLIFPDLIDVPEGIKSFSFDIVDQPGNGPTGFFTFAGCVQGDFSDAPITGASYGEASHSIATGVQLGATITDELAAYDSPNADGDVDDGTILPALAQGTQETFTIKATGAGGYLQGWIDWDGSGTFDAGEQIATDLQDDGTGIDVAAGDGSIGFVVSVPATATTNQTFARFRWSTTSGLDSTTSASDGEVEDYALTITAGPPTPYVSNLPTEICQVNGYGWIDSHPIGMPAGETSPPFDIVTGEWYWDALGLPRRSNTRPPQEFSYDYSSDLAELETSLSATGVNEAWEFIERIEGIPGSASSVDFVDGGAVEHSVVTIEGAAGNVLLRHPALPFTSVRGNASATLNFTFPSDGVVYTRTRFADYQLAHNDPRTEYCQFRDFADAPDSFGKPFHLVRSGIQLGSGVTAEAGGYDDPNAAGDTSDDGVTLPATFEPGTIVTVPVSVSGSGFLNAWIDWNGNGVFDEPTEQIAADIQDPGGSGTINLSVTVPSDAVVGQTFARFRWSSAFDIGFSGAAFDGEVEDYQITINDTSPMLSGRLFIDNGGGGGVAHDGLIGGTELGASVGTIALFDGTSNQLASTFVNADGTWDAMLPVGYSGTVQIVATANPGYRIISEDRSAVPGASNISETDGTYSFNATAATSYSGLNIGLIAAPTLTQNQQASVSPGQVIELPHIYTASTSGNVSFALVDQISTPANGFTSTIFADADCDGAADTVMPALIGVTANQQICLVVRTQAGSGISPTATLTYGLEATTAFTGTTVIDVVRNDDALGSSGTGSDLVLRKVVSNETKAPGIESVSNTGDIGDVLQYRIVMTNPGPGAANDVTVTDATPAYTALSGPIPSPVAVGSGMSCSLVTPAANVAGYSGPLEWSCPGSLSSGAGGSVTFQVTITP